MRLFTPFLVISLLSASAALTLERETCDPKRMMVDIDVANADAVIGGIFDMRLSGDDRYGCGKPHAEIMLAYEAARWTLKRINDNNYVPGVRLGMRAYDTCHSPSRAMHAAMDFYPQYSASSMYCNETRKINLGFLGPITSWTTKPVAEMSSQFPASVISPSASSPELSDKTKYPYFLRTGLSSADQIEAMIALMKELGWQRIVLAYATNDYGGDAIKEFIRQSQNSDVCVVETVKVPPTGSALEYGNSLNNIHRYDVNGAVYFGDHYSMSNVMKALQLKNHTANIQWIVSLVNMNDKVLSNRMRGSIFVTPQFTEVMEFFNYFTNDIDEKNPPPENPWYQDWFMETFECKIQDISYLPYSGFSDCTDKSPATKLAAINTKFAFVDSTIKAMYAYAKALRNAQSAVCGSTGFCQRLRDMTPSQFHNYLKDVNFNFNEVGINSLQDQVVQFDGNGDFMSSAHTIWNYNNQPSSSFGYKQVGSYSAKTLSVDINQIYMYDLSRVNVLPNLPTSPCPPEGCRNCIVPREMVHFTYMPGDVIIAGLFDIHGMGSEVLTCGMLKQSHALEAAAFKFAIEQTKVLFGSDFLRGVELGSLIIDLCDSGETGRLLMNNILGNRHVVRDKYGRVIDPYKIKSVVGTLDSSEAISMAGMLGQFMIPQLEASATSHLLSNRMHFPYFSRVVPSDMVQIRAVVMLLMRFGWRYIQVIHSADAYGRSGATMLRDLAAERSVCIAATHEIGMDGDYNAIVQNLRNKPDARIVVGIMDGDDFRMVLQAMKDNGFSVDEFKLIGTETWGTKQSVVAGLADIAEGALSVDIMSPPIQSFRQWLNALDPSDMDTMKEMPFFTEWYEYAFNCYIDANNRGTYTQQCQYYQGITQAPNYEETSYTQFIISATYAVARAIDMALKDYCGDDYNGVCWQFRTASHLKDKILGYIRDAEFNLKDMNQNTLFKIMDGEGLSDFAIYNFRSGNYAQIGTYRTETRELIDVNPNNVPSLDSYMSQCQGVCGECVYLLQHAPFSVFNHGDLMLGINVAIHNQDLSGDPIKCADLRMTNGLQTGLAIGYALNEVNQNRGPVTLNNVEVGGILFDHCNSPARAYGLPSALYSGILASTDYSPDLNMIRAWLTDNTLVTEEMKGFFQDLNLPVISPMAVSNIFLDEDEYPTFLRTIQGDSTIAAALAILVKSLGFQYVTIVYSANSFGRGGKEAFYQIAQQEGICIIKALELGPGTNTTALVSDLVDQSTHVVVTYMGMRDMETFIDARAANSAALNNLIVFSPEPYAALYARKGPAAKNILSLSMKASNMAGYAEFLGNIDESRVLQYPGFANYYQDLFKCNLPGFYKYQQDCSRPLKKITSSSNYFMDNYILSTINAVYTFVAAAHETLKVQCGENYNGVCANFYSDPNTNTILLQKMKEVNFDDPSDSRFYFIGREGSASRDIQLFNGNSMTKVGEFAGASVNFFSSSFRDTFDGTKSMCVLPCSPCVQTNMNFTYIPGDVLLGGVFDVHEADIWPFSCGEINTLRGFQLLEAFHFAIQQVNDKSGMFSNILKDIRLGGIGLDACQSDIRGGFLVSNIHNGLSVLQRNSHVIDPDDIDVYLGSYSSGRSIYLARLLKTLKIPQVSFGSTSVSLNDTDRYPYFLRTVPADDHQAMAMIRFLRRYNIRYVQIVHTSDNYGEQGAQIFKEKAEENKICVAQTVAFPDKSVVTTESANDVVLALLEKPIANTVVVFADASFINEMLQAIRRNPEAINKFKFIGSDAWANNKEATDTVEDLAVGSVTFDLDTKDLRDFDTYLSSKTPGNYPENPWFSEYYEEIHNCYLTIPDKRYPRRCHATSEDITTSSRYKQDTAIIHVINAVYSAAIGIDMALKEVCGEYYTTVCEAFKNRESKRGLILEKMKNVTFTDLSGHQFSFNSHRGYTVYSIDTEAVFGYVYNPIGKYGGNGELVIRASNYQPSWDGSCNREDSCTECPTIRNLITRYMLKDLTVAQKAENPYPATLVALMNIHSQGVDEYRCGELNVHNFLRALAVKYTIERITSQPFGLRPLILDNCNNQLRIDQDLFNLLSTGKLCNADFDSDGSQIDIKSVIGVFTLGSRFVVAANRVTAPYKVQLLSSYATSNALSDKWRYPYFARTVPPDELMMTLIAKILKENDWSYVGVVHSDENYGISGYKMLREIVNTGQYSCIGFDVTIPAAGTVEELRPIVRQLADLNGIGVIVTLVVDPRPLLEAAVAEGVADRFVWIGTDSWGNFRTTTEGLAQHFRGAISIYFRDAVMENFVDYVKQIDWVNRKDIPDDWFEEFYQQIHKCRLPSATVVMSKYTRDCLLNENITAEMVLQEGVGILDIAAIYAMGRGLQKFVSDCGQRNITDCINSIDDPRERLFAHTLAETWRIHDRTLLTMDGNITSEKFNMEIGSKRYWNSGYRIYNLKHDDNNDNAYIPIGSAEGDDLTFNKDKYTSYKDVVSKCPEDQYCECSISTGTQQQQQTRPKYMGDHEPRNYYVYDNETGEQVYFWPVWAIAVAVCTCVGLAIAILLFLYFLIFYPVRGGTTVLGFIMMIGLFGIYAINFAFFLPASAATCGVREFFMGVIYSIVFAALFVKSVDNWRFKHREYSVKSYRGISNPCTLVLITFGIVLVQCIIPIEWLIVQHPSASKMADSTARHDWMWCDPHDFYDIALVLSMILVMFLVILTAVFSALAWDSESNYYESRWIFVACVCTAGCFLVWMIVSTNAGPPYRDPAVAMGNFMNATAILVFIPIRKLVLLCTIKAEEEKSKGLPLDEQDREMYSTVYTNQTYEPDVFQVPESKHSDSGY